MKIIVFEGLDKSGKHTISNHLAAHLKRIGFKVVQSEFHRYDTPTGKLIWDYLRNDDYNVSNETIQLIMTADKQAQQSWFKELEDDGVDFLILDRYILSQRVYATYFDLKAQEIPIKDYILSRASTTEYQLKELAEYNDMLLSKLRKPDLQIYLDISPEESLKRKGQHGDNDKYEQNLELHKLVRSEFQYYERMNENILKIDAMQKLDKVKRDTLAAFDVHVRNSRL